MATATPNKSNDTSMNSETPLGQISGEFAQEMILESVFYRFLGARPEKDAQLRAAYKSRFGCEMRDLLDHEFINAIYLEGIPGQGKTTIHREAVKEFAALMGMTFHENVTQRMLSTGKIGLNDVVFSIIELAGETSNKEVFGLMTKVKIGNKADGTDHEFMGHLPDWRLAATMFAGYGYVLFDDFATATHQVQNSTLGLLLNGTAGDLQFNVNEIGLAKMTLENGVMNISLPENEAVAREKSSTVHFGLAGNRGARDGNKTFPITTATATRVKRFDVIDTPDQWMSRTLRMNNDALADCQLTGFMEQNSGEHFANLAKTEKGMMAQMPVSRTWDMFLTDLRTIFSKNGGLAKICTLEDRDLSSVLYAIEKAAQGAIGKKTAAAVGGYYNALFLGAAPVADAIIRRGEVDKDFIDKKYNAGSDMAGMNFGYSLASSLAAFAAEDIFKIIGKSPSKADLASLDNIDSPLSKKVRKVFEHFSYGVNQFSTLSLTTFSANQMMRRLASMVPSLFNKNGDSYTPTVTAASLLATGIFVDNQKYAKEQNIEALAGAMSTYDCIYTSHINKELSSKISAVI